MTSTTLAQRIERFDAYFLSANGVPPNARISVPTAEWQELRAALMPQCLHQIAEPAAPQAAPAAVAVPDALLTDEQIEQAFISSRDEFMLREVARRTDKQLRLAFGRAVLKVALAATPAAGAAQAVEPFMWAIKGPDGCAYLDEGCVNSEQSELQAEVEGLNAGLEPEEGRYQIVPVFLCAPQAADRQAIVAAGAAQAAPKQVHQFRRQHCADWYDGHADHGDGGGPYEERTLYAAPQAAATQAAPVLWVSPGQLEKHADRDEGEGGNYLPCRKTQDGNFTMPLYDHPAPAAQEGLARDAVGFSPMWFAPLDGTPVLLYLPTTTDKFAVGRWHGHPDSISGNWGDEEGSFYTHVPAAFMRLQRLADIADKYIPDDVRAAIAAQAAQGGA